LYYAFYSSHLYNFVPSNYYVALSSVDQQTTKEVAKMKLGQSEVQSALFSLTHQVSKVTTDTKKAKGKLEELSRQIQVVNRKQAERAESVEKKQQTLERKFSQTESKVEETIQRDRAKIFQGLTNYQTR